MNKNRLVEAYFYKKEGAILWTIYAAFFFTGYWYGRVDMDTWYIPLIMFIVCFIVIIIFGKKEPSHNPSKEQENANR